MTALSSVTVYAAPGTVSAGASGPGLPASPEVMSDKDLAGLDDQALLAIVRLLPRASERRVAACELLVSRYQGLVWSCVRRYARSPELVEDLVQVGYVGLLKAINNFDPALCRNLATYAQPCISGEIKRHFRDKRWQIHVKRSVQDLMLQARAATGPLAQELGRTPTESDLAAYLRVSVADLRQAERAELAFQPSSLDAPLADLRLGHAAAKAHQQDLLLTRGQLTPVRGDGPHGEHVLKPRILLAEIVSQGTQTGLTGHRRV